MWRRPGACTITAHLSCENRGKRAWASQHHVGALARALPPVLKCCSVVRRQLGVANAMIEAGRTIQALCYPIPLHKSCQCIL